MNFQQTAISVQRQLLELQQSVFTWKQEQAKVSDNLATKIQGLENARHQETITVGKAQVKGTNWQAISAVFSAVVALAALVVSIIALCK